MITAVLESRCSLRFSEYDIYLNVAGGLKITEPAADLAVASALISARVNKPVPADTAFFGEIGLSGEIRTVSHMDTRLKEAEKLGFKKAFLPKKTNSQKNSTFSSTSFTTKEIGHLQDLVKLFLTSS